METTSHWGLHEWLGYGRLGSREALAAALIEHIDLYWGAGWRDIVQPDSPAYARLCRARKALGLEA